ncbi:MAG: hydrogenase expression/formation C-terminal domain-containing protein [Acidocella sp.]|nr:hydrogenase expression/formation C-terminal domain-containing protein [Acidocella sp.]MDE8349541.1 hydrogenase expression/formation C-terminal domain-containing protein [Acidocella sp.]
MLGIPNPPSGLPLENGPDYMPLPKSITVYIPPVLPDDPAIRAAGAGWLPRIAAALETYRIGGPGLSLDLSDVTLDERRFLDELLRPGEVSALAMGEPLLQVEETVFTGLWRIRGETEAGRIDQLEVADIPTVLRTRAKAGPLPLPAPESIPDDVINAPHILAELISRSAEFEATGKTHMINLDLVPMSDTELSWLVSTLGEGPVVIISAGYGSCRIRSTNLAGTWWVQYSNASDALILNSLEIASIPAVACAAADDIADSADRLRSLGGVYQ